MIIPIGHESNTVRRLPWVTFIIIGLCVLTHQSVTRQIRKGSKEQGKDILEYIQYYIEHPYLEPDPEIEKLYMPDPKQRELFKEQLKLNMQYLEKPDDSTIRQRQEDLDILAKKAKNAISSMPYYNWGHVPSRGGFVTLITYQFLHAPGIMHIFFNLLFLYLLGPFLEDKWGRPVYASFYILTGIFSALFFSFHYPNSTVPLVGASGAIAGLMGGFLVFFHRTRIKFFYWFFLFFRGTFKAPAWLMLPMWLFLEFGNAKMVDKISDGSSGGVAHWAHVWGFIFGFAFALVIKKLGIDKRLEKKLGPEVIIVNPGYIKYEEAMGLLQEGNHTEGFSQLIEAAQSSPADVEIGESLWEAGIHMDRISEVTPHFIRLIESEIRNRDFDRALNHLNQLKVKDPDATIGLQSQIALVDHLIQREEILEAENFVNEILSKISPASPPGILLQLAPACIRLDPRIKERIIGLVLQHPEIPDIQKEELKNKFELARMSDYRHQSSVEATDHDSLEVDHSNRETVDTSTKAHPSRIFKSTEVTPLELREDKLIVETKDQKKKMLPLKLVTGISVSKIHSTTASPYYLVDLILSNLDDINSPINSIRLMSTRFSPQEIVSSKGSDHDALKVFLSFLLQLSEAEPLPNIEAVLFLKTEEYYDIPSYERTFTSP